mmetsp:Transcript_18718/g.47354  ORF Transcript_18718/g.47354 Transcript_18718/m.47354 type:complete len:223 (-) Transcript_18718:1757-2425(-)
MRVLTVNELQNLDFVKRLIDEVLLIFDYFHTHQFACREVDTLHSCAKCSRAKHIFYLISTCNDHVLFNAEFLFTFEPSSIWCVHNTKIEPLVKVAIFSMHEVAFQRVLIRHFVYLSRYSALTTFLRVDEGGLWACQSIELHIDCPGKVLHYLFRCLSSLLKGGIYLAPARIGTLFRVGLGRGMHICIRDNLRGHHTHALREQVFSSGTRNTVSLLSFFLFTS